MYAGCTPDPNGGVFDYPAVQNTLLAARALGLGATLTTLYLNFEKEVEGALPCRGTSLADFQGLHRPLARVGRVGPYDDRAGPVAILDFGASAPNAASR